MEGHLGRRRNLAKIYNRNYAVGRMTKTEVWSPVTSYYDNLPLPSSGVMRANSPWSGHYEVQPAVWATAHTTQFAAPGWTYLNTGCGLIEGVGSHVTLKSPRDGDFSIVIETMDATAPGEFSFCITGGLSRAPIHVWRTNRKEAFELLPDLVAKVWGASRSPVTRSRSTR